MDVKTIKILEFDKIKEFLAQNTVSVQAKEAALALEPLHNADAVKILLEQTDEAVAVIEKHGRSPIHAYHEIRGILARIKLGAVLSMPELLDIALFLKAVREARSGIAGGNEDEDGRILQYARALVAFKDIEEQIFADILSEDEMADSASSRLASIRRQIRSQNESVREKLNSLMRTLDKEGILQEGIITMRSDRYVLPVVAAHRAKVPGIVHDQSSSGATLFIEPMAVVEINNTIRQLKLDERDEIQRILEDYSIRLHDIYGALESNSRILAQLDLIFAKAKLSREMDGTCPVINEKGYVEIKNGRHPLLDKRTVVPIRVWLGKEFTQLLITGPNTGGKTVTLKTIGLFAVMTQSGLHLPAENGTTMPVFDNIFADIGDEQSIEQNLSTFSSHMKNISRIMKEITPDALVLFDELGAGTDPTEGAALAMAILEELRRRRIRTVVTSHYAELKAYSLSKAGAENASVEFDVNSLQPTYKLMVGVPGNSNAFLISAKLGLDQYLIDRARSYVDEDSRKLEKVLSNAEEYRAAAQSQRQEAFQLRAEAEKERKLLEKENRELTQKKEKILAQAQREAQQIREKALEEANSVIDELKSLSASAEPAAIFKARELRKSLQSVPQKENVMAEAPLEPIREFLPGMDVYVSSLDKDGVLLTKPNAKGKVRVQLGILQTEVNAKELTYAKSKKDIGTSGVKISRSNTNVPLSLDVRGQLAEEAVVNVDMYLDLAYGRNIGSVMIIHGKGTGALRKAIAEYLKRNPKVASFRAGTYGEGDAGVTVVELKG